jgi:hypothetical protein
MPRLSREPAILTDRIEATRFRGGFARHHCGPAGRTDAAYDLGEAGLRRAAPNIVETGTCGGASRTAALAASRTGARAPCLRTACQWRHDIARAGVPSVAVRFVAVRRVAVRRIAVERVLDGRIAARGAGDLDPGRRAARARAEGREGEPHDAHESSGAHDFAGHRAFGAAGTMPGRRALARVAKRTVLQPRDL